MHVRRRRFVTCPLPGRLAAAAGGRPALRHQIARLGQTVMFGEWPCQIGDEHHPQAKFKPVSAGPGAGACRILKQGAKRADKVSETLSF